MSGNRSRKEVRQRRQQKEDRHTADVKFYNLTQGATRHVLPLQPREKCIHTPKQEAQVLYLKDILSEHNSTDVSGIITGYVVEQFDIVSTMRVAIDNVLHETKVRSEQNIRFFNLLSRCVDCLQPDGLIHGIIRSNGHIWSITVAEILFHFFNEILHIRTRPFTQRFGKKLCSDYSYTQHKWIVLEKVERWYNDTPDINTCSVGQCEQLIKNIITSRNHI